MATLDIFNDDAFSVTALTETIQDIPNVPTLLGDLNIFREYGIRTTTMMIERQGATLSLVPTAPRGGVRDTGEGGKRILLPIAAVHIPQGRKIMADEVQGIRAFGSETEVKQVQQIVIEKQTSMRENLDLTLEHMRVGALRGQVLDADGVSVLWDMYDIFGMSKVVKYWNIATANTSVDLVMLTEELKRDTQAKLGGRGFSKIRVIASPEFFDKFVRHDKMIAAWDKWQEGAYNRSFPSTTNYEFNGVIFTVYNYGVNGRAFIPAGLAYSYPEGVPGMFNTAFAPGDYMDTVNQTGVPFYSSQEPLPHRKGVDLESQSNPIFYNKFPEAVFELDVDAS